MQFVAGFNLDLTFFIIKKKLLRLEEFRKKTFQLIDPVSN
jgi:hypothetical protein